MRILIAFILFLNVAHARDLGVMGEVYPIKEVDFLSFIQSRIQDLQNNGKWDSLQKNLSEEAKKYRDRPTPVKGISRAEETKTWVKDPSIVVDNHISSLDGKLIALKGTRVNPFKFIPLSKTLIFYNADDLEQVNWVSEKIKKSNGKIKLILVDGSVLVQEEKFKQVIYFDQHGKLTTYFGITHVPAWVVQSGDNLEVTEVGL